MTIASTGNVLQAGLQYGANTAIKNETGKDTIGTFTGSSRKSKQE